MLDRVLRLFLGLVVGVWVARYLGPDRYGLLSYAMSFASLFGVFALLGLDDIIVRNSVQDPNSQNKLLGTTFGLRLLSGVSVIFLVYIVLNIAEDDANTRSLVLIFVSGYLFRYQVFESYFRARVLAKYVSYAYLAGLILSSIAKIVLIWISAPLIPFAAVFILEWMLILVITFYFYNATQEHIGRWIFSLKKAKELLADSWPLILAGMVSMIYMRIDQIMIKEILGERANGYYAAAARLSEAWYFIPVALTNSLFPALIKSKSKSHEFYHGRVQKLYQLVIWIAIFVALPITFLGDQVINILYGVQYSDAGGVLVIHIWAGIFISIGVINTKWLFTENIQVYNAINTSIGAFFNIVLNLWLIPVYGIKGAAISTLVSYAIATYFALIIWDKTRESFLVITRAIFLVKWKSSVKNY